jgi:hypothetical protein
MTVLRRLLAAVAIAGLALVGAHLGEPASPDHVVVTPATDGAALLAQSSEAFLD